MFLLFFFFCCFFCFFFFFHKKLYVLLVLEILMVVMIINFFLTNCFIHSPSFSVVILSIMLVLDSILGVSLLIVTQRSIFGLPCLKFI